MRSPAGESAAKVKSGVRFRVCFFGSGDLRICACSCMAWLKLVISMLERHRRGSDAKRMDLDICTKIWVINRSNF